MKTPDKHLALLNAITQAAAYGMLETKRTIRRSDGKEVTLLCIKYPTDGGMVTSPVCEFVDGEVDKSYLSAAELRESNLNFESMESIASINSQVVDAFRKSRSKKSKDKK